MTPRQRRFVLEYLIDANGVQAARRAGYRRRDRGGGVTRLLRHPEIRAALDAAMAARARRTGVTVERVLDELVRVAFAELSPIVAWGADGARLTDGTALPADACAAIAALATDEDGRAVAVRLHDKGAALALLARRLGLFGRAAPAERTEAARAKSLVEARLAALRAGP
jgi:phage terminase small subunit